MNKKSMVLMFISFFLVLMICSCGDQKNEKKEETKMNGLKKETWTIDRHGKIYAYLPDDLKADEKRPLILDMNCTSGNPQAEVKTNGWDKAAVKDRLIIIAPTYDDYVTYSETDYMIKVLDQALERYHGDSQRVYATGFSNGGALSVALASEYPKRFAAISAAGWMVGARNTAHGYLMPFQVLQGTKEYTEKDDDGNMTIMDDEKEAIADLFTMNGMNRGESDYHQTPYWGYQADRTKVIYPKYTDYDPYGKNARKKSHVRWRVSDYYKNSYTHPLAQFVLIDGADHVPHDYHATIAWEFFKHFKRNSDGQLEEDEQV